MNYAQLLATTEVEGLRSRVRAALLVAAEGISRETGTVPNNANRRKWAAAVFAGNVPTEAFVNAYVARRKADDPIVVRTANDADVQTIVDSLVDLFATG